MFLITTGPLFAENIIIEPDDSPHQLNYSLSGRVYSARGQTGVALALSGGGARGLAHIGVLEVLQENNIRIKFIAGTSMGAVIGGLYSAGYSPSEIHQIALGIDWDALFSSAPLRSSILVSAKGRPEKALLKIGLEGWRPAIPRGITSGQKLSNLLTRLCYRAGVRATISFDLLDTPFRAIATDLATGQLQVLGSGDLAEAMRASLAFPIGFTPVLTQGRLLVDGGLIIPIPVDLCRDLAGGPVIAVNTTTPLLPVESISNAIEMADQSTTVMTMPRLQEQLKKADLVLSPTLETHKNNDFKNVEKLIQAGRQAALAQLPAIKAALLAGDNDSGPVYLTDRVNIVGLRNMPETYFLKDLFIDSLTSEAAVRENLRNILKTGFVQEARAQLTSQSERYEINYILKDNPRIRILSFTGLTLFSPQTIHKAIESKVGQVVNSNTLAADIKSIERLYSSWGYTLARVQSIQVGQADGIVTFVIDEGRISGLRVEGNHRTRDWIILRDTHLRRGDIFVAAKAQRSLDDLYATGLFETVKLTAQPCSIGIELAVKVEEKSFDYIRAGMRHDREYQSAGFVDLVGSNLFGTGNEIYLSGQFGEKKRAYQLNIKADRIFRTYLTYHLTAGHSVFKRNFYIDHEYNRYLLEQGTGLEFEIGQQFPRLGKLSTAIDFERHFYEDPFSAMRFDKRRTSVSIRSLVDTFNSLPVPERGKLHYFELEFAGEIFGGEMTYTKFYTSIEAYYPLPAGLNFHPRAELGFFNRTPPYFKLFSLGGRRIFYGLYEHELTGEKIFDGSMELRKKITDYLFISARYDFGKVWNKLQSIRFDRLEHGAGASLILKTIAGPLGIAYGRTSMGQEAFYFYAGYDY